MIKPFIFLAAVLILMVMGVGVHFASYPYDKHTVTLQNLAKLTNYTELSLSLAYDENSINSTYPEMSSLDRMDFVYER